ncbi:hypothetical protein evm_008268 [Chilo suppressalis]|nr:hypothetical protein evm_008268 [Chilo suppressalis]
MEYYVFATLLYYPITQTLQCFVWGLDINTGKVLSFERNYYLGLLNGTNVNLPQIVLNEGFLSDVRFSLVGELAPFFILQDNLATLTISLANAIPEDPIPANGIIIIQVEATAPQVLSAYTSIILV